MNNNLDPEKLKIPAYMRKKAIVRQSRQKLILTALDRKQAGLDVHSHKALAPLKSPQFKSVKEKTYSNVSRKPSVRKAKATSYRPAPNLFEKNPFRGNSSDSMSQKEPKRSLLRSLFPGSDDEPEDQPQLQPPRHQAPTGFVKIQQVGHITAYIEKIQVAIIKLDKPLRLGDLIQITADDMLFQQPVDSMQINRKPVKIAKKGSEIGLKVSHEPQLNGAVYKVLV
jgi:putative protease